MKETYTLRYSKDLVKRAVLSYFFRKMGKGYFIAIVLLSGYFVYELIDGNQSWIIGLIGAVIGFAFIIPVAGIVGHIRIGLRKLVEMKDATATLTITENCLIVQSDIGSSEITWKTITEVWQYPDYWVMLSGGSFLMTIPQSELDDNGRKSILAMLEKAKIA